MTIDVGIMISLCCSSLSRPATCVSFILNFCGLSFSNTSSGVSSHTVTSESHSLMKFGRKFHREKWSKTVSVQRKAVRDILNYGSLISLVVFACVGGELHRRTAQRLIKRTGQRDLLLFDLNLENCHDYPCDGMQDARILTWHS